MFKVVSAVVTATFVLVIPVVVIVVVVILVMLVVVVFTIQKKINVIITYRLMVISI